MSKIRELISKRLKGLSKEKIVTLATALEVLFENQTIPQLTDLIVCLI